jgi:hypothetical protein
MLTPTPEWLIAAQTAVHSMINPVNSNRMSAHY